jgi:hypothetical protein
MPFFSISMASWTSHEVHDPQSPVERRTASHFSAASLIAVLGEAVVESPFPGRNPTIFMSLNRSFRRSPTLIRNKFPFGFVFQKRPTLLPSKVLIRAEVFVLNILPGDVGTINSHSLSLSSTGFLATSVFFIKYLLLNAFGFF